MTTTIAPPTLAVNGVEVKTPKTPTIATTMTFDDVDKSSVDQEPLHLIIDDALPAQQRSGSPNGPASAAPNELSGSPKMTNGHADEASANRKLSNGESSPKSGSRSEPRFLLPSSSSVNFFSALPELGSFILAKAVTFFSEKS